MVKRQPHVGPIPTPGRPAQTTDNIELITRLLSVDQKEQSYSLVHTPYIIIITQTKRPKLTPINSSACA